MSDLLILFLILGLVLCSAFMSGSESALTASSRARLLYLEKNGDRHASLANSLLADRDRVIGSILFSNNLFNTLAAALATGFFLARFGEGGILLATIVMTVLISFCGEVLPKLYALQQAEKSFRKVAPILNSTTIVTRPVVNAAYALARCLLAPAIRAGEKSREEAESQELRGAIEAYGAGDERHMLRSILELQEVDVSDVMVHRSEVRSLSAELSGQELIAAALAIPHTRIPVWREAQENIVGVLTTKDLFRASRKPQGEGQTLNAAASARVPWFTPETTNLLDQLRAFRARREHFAIVVDEYGEMQGVVTLEDILEEIVGEIFDEEDTATETPRDADASKGIEVPGNTPLRDLNRQYGWSLPDNEATTLAGLILHEAQRIPEEGEELRFHGFCFRVLKRDGNALASLTLTPPAEATDKGKSKARK